MIIRGGSVYQEDKCFAERDLYIENGIIVESPEQVSDNSVISAEGLLVLPGLIDVHSHGAVGHDFSDGNPEGIRQILAYQLSHGITSYCLTSMSLSKKDLLKAFQSVKDWQDESSLAHIAGINMEGPFLNASKRGAHREDCILPPDPDFFRECNSACGNRIRLITLAPETEGALELISELKNDIVVSLGHSSADYQTAKAAFHAGASHVTHLFNAMSPFGHRNPGLIGAATEEQNCMVELICDGVHVHESMVRAAFQLFPDRIVLISDSMRATGMETGTYDLGGQQVTVSAGHAVLSDGTIAGSVLNLFDCMKKAVSFGIPLEEAIAAATMNPAKSIGIYHITGSLTPGKRADIILVDKELNLVHVFRG